MACRLTISVEFSFKGVDYSPSLVLNLDTINLNQMNVDSFHSLLANANQIDNYSYEHEVMLSSPILFADPEGLATAFLIDGNLDINGLTNAMDEERFFKQYRHALASDSSTQHLVQTTEIKDDLKRAALIAYQLGKKPTT
jgi:hypothetical protein